MEETTTTTTPEETGVVATTEPAETGVDTAVTTEDPQLPTTNQDEPSEDDNLSWVKTKGVDPSDPEAVSKLAEMYRNAEKAMHESNAKASELQKSLTNVPETPQGVTVPEELENIPFIKELAEEVNALKESNSKIAVANSVSQYFESNPDAKQYEAKMTEIVSTRPEIGQAVKLGVLSFDDLYAMALSSKDVIADAKQAGGKEALETVRQKQQARSVQGQATTSALSDSITKENVDAWYAGLSSAERAKPENQAIVSRLLSD